jgi:spore germination protein GerM
MKKYTKTFGVLFVVSSILIGCNLPQQDQEPVTPQETPATQAAAEKPAEKPVSETTVVKVFFNNPKIDPNWEFECSNVFAVERTIPKTDAVALAAITELLKGPTAAEIEKGYMTNINSGVKVQKLTIVNSVAKIDFNEQLQFQVGGSCKISAIYAQIKQTLKQFPSVKDVIISINGQTEDILQP